MIDENRRWSERVNRRRRAAVQAAPQGGARFTFLVRLVPVNRALLSYALGALTRAQTATPWRG